jgi:hypothetical protein
LHGATKDEILAEHYSPVPGLWSRQPLAPAIDEVAAGSFKRREPPEIEGSGYVVRSLEAALWALHRSREFRDGCLLAVNLGDDADTTGAVYGQLAGALYGVEAISAQWRARLAKRELIEMLARDCWTEPAVAPTARRRQRSQTAPRADLPSSPPSESGGVALEWHAPGREPVRILASWRKSARYASKLEAESRVDAHVFAALRDADLQHVRAAERGEPGAAADAAVPSVGLLA